MKQKIATSVFVRQIQKTNNFLCFFFASRKINPFPDEIIRTNYSKNTKSTFCLAVLFTSMDVYTSIGKSGGVNRPLKIGFKFAGQLSQHEVKFYCYVKCTQFIILLNNFILKK
jgi:hypothetical protein